MHIEQSVLRHIGYITLIHGVIGIAIIECAPKGIERDDLWIVWVPGRKGTLW